MPKHFRKPICALMLAVVLLNTLQIPLLVHAAEAEEQASPPTSESSTASESAAVAAEPSAPNTVEKNTKTAQAENAPSQPVSDQSKAPPTQETNAALRATETVTPPYLLTPSNQPATSNSKNGLKGLKGNFQTDLFTGGGTFSYPLDIIPGRGGMTPNVALSYSTQNTRQDSLVGYGWDINTSSIYRSSNKGTNKLYSENSFTASIFGSSEELVLTNTASGEYRPRIEGSFHVYNFVNGSWSAKDKNGTQYIFGTNAINQQANPADATKVYKWMLEKIIDTNGNYMTFSYTKDQGQIYPDTIRYTGNASDPGIFEIRFTLENRPFAVRNATSGFTIITAKRIKQIDMRLNTTGSYQTAYSVILNYSDSGLMKNRVITITESSGTQSLPPTTFTYTTGTEVPVQLPGLLKSIQTSYGGQTTLSYQSSRQMVNGTARLNPKLFLLISTVKSVTTKNSATDTPKTTNYSYQNGHYFFDMLDSYKREYAGFGQVTVTDPLGQVQKLYFHQSEKDAANATNSPLGEYQDHLSKKGRIYRTENYDNANHLYTVSVSKWDRSDMGNGRSFPFLSQEVTMNYDGGIPHRDSAVSYQYDSYGNTTVEKNWGEVAATNDGSFTDNISDTTVKENVYALNSTSYIAALPQQITLKDGGGTQLQQQRFYYDNLPLGQVAKGNLTKQEDWLNPGNRYIASNQQTFNAFGLVTSSTDARGKVTASTYDNFNLYPATVTNPLGHIVATTYDYPSGQLKQSTDANGTKTQNTYDPFGRLVRVEISDPASPSLLKTIHTTQYFDSEQPMRVVTTDFNGQTGDTGKPSVQFFDGFGNLLQTRVTAEGSNTYTVNSQVYDEKNRVKKEFLAVYQTGTSFITPGINDPGNLMAYDPLDRVKSITNSLGTTSTVYDRWNQTVTDANNHTKKLSFDAYQNLIQVDEKNASSTYVTRYDYDRLNRLIKITDAENNIRNFTYDSLGRLLSQDLLHGVGSTGFGVWSYGYDDGGNLLNKTDPNNQVVNYTYDDLSRLLTEDFTGTAGVEVKNDYDDRPNAKGQLIRVTMAGYVIGLLYDPLGRVISRYDVVDGVNYITNSSYDLLGNVMAVTYPNNKMVAYQYNNAYMINGVLNGGTALVSNVDYSPLGMIARIDFGNGTSSVNTYDIAKLYRLTNKKTTKGVTLYQDLSYSYDPIGNLLSISENAPTAAKRNAVYTYDDLDRLLTATVSNTNNNSNVTQTFSYSATGNILSNSLLGAYSYDRTNNANPQAVTRVGTNRTYGYDKNGNVTATTNPNGNQSLTYDYRNNLVQSAKGAAATKYIYDAGFNRIKKYTPNGTSSALQMYIGDYEIEGNGNNAGVLSTPNLQRINISLGKGQSVSLETNPTTNTTTSIYHHTDHLTGSSVDTDPGGYMLEVQDYLPFGSQRVDQRFQSYANKKKFTGKELDTESGLYYYGARYYDSDIGRFASVDPAVIGQAYGKSLLDLLSSPQQLNHYSYVANNPLKYVDPKGQFLQILAAIGAVVATAIDLLTTFFSGIPSANAPGPEGPITAENAPPAPDWVSQTAMDMAAGAVIGGIVGKGIGAGIEYIGGKIFREAGEEAIQATTSTIRQGIDEAVNADIPRVSGDVLPNYVQDTLSQLESNGFKQLDGYQGGTPFRNKEGMLPAQELNYYTEFDVKPFTNNADRGVERIIVGGQGETNFFTNTHYGTAPNGIDPPFYQIK